MAASSGSMNSVLDVARVLDHPVLKYILKNCKKASSEVIWFIIVADSKKYILFTSNHYPFFFVFFSFYDRPRYSELFFVFPFSVTFT